MLQTILGYLVAFLIQTAVLFVALFAMIRVQKLECNYVGLGVSVAIASILGIALKPWVGFYLSSVIALVVLFVLTSMVTEGGRANILLTVGVGYAVLFALNLFVLGGRSSDSQPPKPAEQIAKEPAQAPETAGTNVPAPVASIATATNAPVPPPPEPAEPPVSVAVATNPTAPVIAEPPVVEPPTPVTIPETPVTEAATNVTEPTPALAPAEKVAEAVTPAPDVATNLAGGPNIVWITNTVWITNIAWVTNVVAGKVPETVKALATAPAVTNVVKAPPPKPRPIRPRAKMWTDSTNEVTRKFSLKSVTQNDVQSMAMVNSGSKSYVILLGETVAMKTVDGGSVAVRCEWVDDNSAVLNIGGERVTILLP